MVLVRGIGIGERLPDGSSPWHGEQARDLKAKRWSGERAGLRAAFVRGPGLLTAAEKGVSGHHQCSYPCEHLAAGNGPE